MKVVLIVNSDPSNPSRRLRKIHVQNSEAMGNIFNGEKLKFNTLSEVPNDLEILGKIESDLILSRSSIFSEIPVGVAIPLEPISFYFEGRE